MNKSTRFASLFTCLVSVGMFGCGSAGDSGSEVPAGSVSEAISPINTFMYVRRDTLPCVPPKCVLSEDPNRPTPSLTQVTVYDNASSDSGTYSTTADQAIVLITAAEWANMTTLLSDPTHQVQVGITYDNSVAGTKKPILNAPTFTLVSP